MDNNTEAPVIPAGTERMNNAAYNPLAGQANVSPDMGKQESQTETSVESKPAETLTETIYAELAAKKGFKTPDDLAKAYMNLETQNKRVEMGLSELAKLRNETQQSAELAEQIPAQVETQDDAMKVVERVVKKVTRPLEDKLALQDLMLRVPDVKEYAAEMASVVKLNPSITWEAAYKVAKFDALQKTAREEGRKEAYQAVQQKQAASVASSKPRASNERALDDLIRDKGIPFKEVQRIMRERFRQ